MATKPNNKTSFFSTTHGTVELVSRSIDHYTWVKPDGTILKYWQGQLVNDWSGSILGTPEWWRLNKGQVIWLDSSIFAKVHSSDYLEYVEI
jgi:hypothetical protein